LCCGRNRCSGVRAPARSRTSSSPAIPPLSANRRRAQAGCMRSSMTATACSPGATARARLQARCRGHRLEADRVALRVRPNRQMGQDQEPGRASGAATGGEGLERMIRTPDWPQKPDAISGRIIPWAGDQLGIAYDYQGGKHEANPIEANDWPIVDRLERTGQVTYTNDRARELAVKVRENNRR
jgi:hypothetical protein